MAVVNNITKKEQRVKNVFRVIMKQETKAPYKVDDGSKKISDLQYAQAFAHTGLKMSGDDLLMQIPHILNNLQYWRGDEARRCKKVLKEFGGVR